MGSHNVSVRHPPDEVLPQYFIIIASRRLVRFMTLSSEVEWQANVRCTSTVESSGLVWLGVPNTALARNLGTTANQ